MVMLSEGEVEKGSSTLAGLYLSSADSSLSINALRGVQGSRPRSVIISVGEVEKWNTLRWARVK